MIKCLHNHTTVSQVLLVGKIFWEEELDLRNSEKKMSWQEDKAHLDDIKFVAVKKVEEEQKKFLWKEEKFQYLYNICLFESFF